MSASTRYAVAVRKCGIDGFARHNLMEILHPNSPLYQRVAEYVEAAGSMQLCNPSPWYFQNYLSFDLAEAEEFARKLSELSRDNYRVVRLEVQVNEVESA